MIAAAFILPLLVGSTYGFDYFWCAVPRLCPDRAVIAIMSDGRQLMCKKGSGSPNSGPTREVIIISDDNSLWTCDEVVQSEPTYLKDIIFPEAFVKAKETAAFAAYLPGGRIVATCNPMVAGDDAKVGAVGDKRYFIISNITRNLKLFCEDASVVDE